MPSRNLQTTPSARTKVLERSYRKFLWSPGQDEDKDKDPEKVTLMTIHMAKGLEFSYVYIAGLRKISFRLK